MEKVIVRASVDAEIQTERQYAGYREYAGHIKIGRCTFGYGIEFKSVLLFPSDMIWTL